MAPTLTISVAIPAYEPAVAHLTQALASVRAQTRRVDEVVITDDSAASNHAWVRDAAADMPLKYVHNTRRRGMVGNWNHAVRHSSGSHVVQLHQDDVLGPTAVARMERAFLSRDGVALCGVGEDRIDEAGKPIRTKTRSNHRDHIFVRQSEYELTYDELTYLMLRHGQIFGPPSAVMFSRAHFDVVGGFDDAFHHSVDIDFVLRMAHVGLAVYVPEHLISNRRHGAQTTVKNVAAGHTLRDRALLYERHAPLSARPEDLAAIRANLLLRSAFDGARAARHGRWSVASLAVRQSAEFWPGVKPLGARALELLRRKNRDER